MNAWKRWFGPSAQELIDKAVQRAALLAAEVEEARTMARYYAALVDSTDAHTDWWGFAHNKQAWSDSINELHYYTERYERACADVNALMAERNK